MGSKRRVILTREDREMLENIVASGRAKKYRIRHAGILLALDEIPANRGLTDVKIAAAFQVWEHTVANIRKRYEAGGLKAALGRARQPAAVNAKMDEEAEAKIVALASGKPPEGYARWTTRLLAVRVVELGILESISHTAVWELLKKLKPSGAFVP
jgi:transposase